MRILCFALAAVPSAGKPKVETGMRLLMRVNMPALRYPHFALFGFDLQPMFLWSRDPERPHDVNMPGITTYYHIINIGEDADERLSSGT